MKGLCKIKNYILFESIRPNKEGGSLITGVHCNLQPVLIFEDNELEILIVQVKLGNYLCRFFNAYGPQEGSGIEYKTKITAFYSTLDQEIKNALFSDCLIFIETDANAKVGPTFIKRDPNEMSQNGKFLIDLISKNNLILCNSLDLCDGTLTRERETINGKEESILDYVIICQEMHRFISSMKIDKNNALCRYSKRNKEIVIKKSDHHLIRCEFSFIWNSKITHKNSSRQNIFNFKNSEGLQKYKNMTSSDILSKCFQGKNVLEESHKWLKTFKNILHRCFPIIRLSDKNHDKNNLIIAKMSLKSKLLQEIEKIKISPRESDLELPG